MLVLLVIFHSNINQYFVVTGTGNTVVKAVAVLKEHCVPEENIILSNLFCTPYAAKSLTSAFPQV
jgi:uracil phosphoribosyltransferase